jgi:hypothetical protein
MKSRFPSPITKKKGTMASGKRAQYLHRALNIADDGSGDPVKLTYEIPEKRASVAATR